jgi:hypothetical protein
MTNEPKKPAKPKRPFNGSVTQELKAIQFDANMPIEKRVLAEQIEEMREQSKAHDIDTTVIDQFAKEELGMENKKDEIDKK